MNAVTTLRFRMRRCVLPHAEVTEKVAGAMQVDLPLSPPEGIVHADKEEAAIDHPQLSHVQVSLFPGGDDLCDEQLVSYELGRKVIASGFLLPHILRSFFLNSCFTPIMTSLPSQSFTGPVPALLPHDPAPHCQAFPGTFPAHS